jgi:ABC-type lipoprotein export system ATPase subunit
MIAELSQVTKFYNAGPGRVQKVLGGVDLTIAAADTVAIVGSSGSGKSTLLNILGTLDRPTTGEVALFGRSLTGMDERDMAVLRAQKLGFIFQLHHLLPQLSALENVLLPTLALRDKASREGKPQRAQHLLERVGLAEHLHKRPGQLSGGERQRVAVVRALINEPEMILADEPTGALDEENAGALVELLAELNRETRVAVVMVTHDLRLAGKMQRVARLKAGNLEWIQSESPA